MELESVDALLERYLILLDEYTQLRQQLSKLQANVFHNIARANFSAERGLRYGQDQYDDRMQALRTLEIEEVGKTPSFAVINAVAIGKEPPPERDADKDDDEDESETKDEKAKSDADDGKIKSKDPLRWFGILAPIYLRNAQALSIEVVEQVIPRLVTVNGQMQALEIKVRRARKKRAKAEEKSKLETHQQDGVDATPADSKVTTNISAES